MITGTVITAVMRGGSMYATVSIINVYKEGSLAIQQAGKTMSTKIVILCKKCPFIRRGKFKPVKSNWQKKDLNDDNQVDCFE